MRKWACHLPDAVRIICAQLAMQGLDVNVRLCHSHCASTLSTNGCCYRFQVHQNAEADLNQEGVSSCLLSSS